MTVEKTDLLIELVQKKHQCLIRLEEIGKTQLRLVRDGHLAPLLDLLAAKQRVLWELEETEQALAPFRRQAPEQRTWRTAEDQHRCRELIARCEELLAAIMAREKESERELDRRRQEAAAQLEGAYQASRARGAYLAASPTTRSQLDLTTED